MTDAWFAHTATLLPNGQVLVAGGYGVSLLLSSAELYTPASTPTPTPTPTPTATPTATATATATPTATPTITPSARHRQHLHLAQHQELLPHQGLVPHHCLARLRGRSEIPRSVAA